MKKILAGLIIVLLVAVTVAVGSKGPAQSPDLTLKFVCLWWSEAEMGHDPNNPPPKTTPVEIKKWEYSDPVGVPHPDSVDIVGNFKVSGNESYHVSVEQRWKVGPFSKKAAAKWEKWELLSDSRLADLHSGERRLATVDIKSKMDPLFAKSRWPWELQVKVSIWADAKRTKLLKEVSSVLPFQPGD